MSILATPYERRLAPWCCSLPVKLLWYQILARWPSPNVRHRTHFLHPWAQKLVTASLSYRSPTLYHLPCCPSQLSMQDGLQALVDLQLATDMPFWADIQDGTTHVVTVVTPILAILPCLYGSGIVELFIFYNCPLHGGLSVSACHRLSRSFVKIKVRQLTPKLKYQNLFLRDGFLGSASPDPVVLCHRLGIGDAS